MPDVLADFLRWFFFADLKMSPIAMVGNGIIVWRLCVWWTEDKEARKKLERMKKRD